MALAVAQSNKGAKTSSTGTSQTVSFLSNTTTGNGIIVGAAYDSGATAPVNTMTCGGVSMTKILDQVEGGGAISNGGLWYLQNITGATTPAVVANLSGAYIGGLIIAEISGEALAALLDAQNKTNGAAAAAASGTVTNVNAAAIIFGLMTTGDSGNTYTGTNSTIILQQQKVGTTLDMALGYKIVAAAALQTISASLTNLSDFAEVLGSFKAPSTSLPFRQTLINQAVKRAGSY